MKFEFHPDAEQELQQIALRYEGNARGLGRRFGDEVDRVIQLLLDHPEMGSQIDEALRHFVLRKFPFSVVYAVSAGRLLIVAIAHSSREPEYWRLRVHDR